MTQFINCPMCGKRSWGCKCNPRPKVNNFSGLAGNRSPETMKGPVVPIFETVVEEDGITFADSRNPADVINKTKGEPNVNC